MRSSAACSDGMVVSVLRCGLSAMSLIPSSVSIFADTRISACDFLLTAWALLSSSLSALIWSSFLGSCCDLTVCSSFRTCKTFNRLEVTLQIEEIIRKCGKFLVGRHVSSIYSQCGQRLVKFCKFLFLSKGM